MNAPFVSSQCDLTCAGRSVIHETSTIATIGSATSAFIARGAEIGAGNVITVNASMDSASFGRAYAGNLAYSIALGAQVIKITDISVQTAYVAGRVGRAAALDIRAGADRAASRCKVARGRGRCIGHRR